MDINTIIEQAKTLGIPEEKQQEFINMMLDKEVKTEEKGKYGIRTFGGMM